MRPFTASEATLMCGRWVRRKDNHDWIRTIWQVVEDVEGARVIFRENRGYLFLECLFDYFEFLDGSPCGCGLPSSERPYRADEIARYINYIVVDSYGLEWKMDHITVRKTGWYVKLINGNQTTLANGYKLLRKYRWPDGSIIGVQI